MAKLSSLKIKMGQLQYEKQRKEHKLQAMKVGFSQDDCFACCMIMVLTSPFGSSSVFIFEGKKSSNLVCSSFPSFFFFCFRQNYVTLQTMI